MQPPPLDDATAFGAIALGANLPSVHGPPLTTLRRAVEAIESVVKVIGVSGYYRTPSFPAGSGPDYVNAALTFKSTQSPWKILEHLHRIEAEIGRVRGQRWGARVVDLDLLFLGDAILPDAEIHQIWRSLSPQARIEAVPEHLILPHPRLQDRGFVLVPLADVAPDWIHPILDSSVREMRDALTVEDLADVRPIG